MIAFLMSGWMAFHEVEARRAGPAERASPAVSTRPTVLQSLVLASQGLLFISESDAPFSPVDAPATPFASLDDATVRALAGHPAEDPVERISVDYLFRNAVQQQPWHTPREFEDVKRYQALVALLHSTLPDAQVFRVGKISIDVLILGTGPGGGALGLATKVVET